MRKTQEIFFTFPSLLPIIYSLINQSNTPDYFIHVNYQKN